jgi:uncharacterized lipoprotein
MLLPGAIVPGTNRLAGSQRLMAKGDSMNTMIKVLVGASCLAIAACDVDQTQEGNLPDVDVNATGGQLPEFNVEGPDVNVGTENKTVQVPTVDVDVPDEAEGNTANQ